MNLLSLSLFRGGEISYNQVNKGMVRALGIEPRILFLMFEDV